MRVRAQNEVVIAPMELLDGGCGNDGVYAANFFDAEGSDVRKCFSALHCGCMFRMTDSWVLLFPAYLCPSETASFANRAFFECPATHHESGGLVDSSSKHALWPSSRDALSV